MPPSVAHPPTTESVVLPGNYDGVHLGHRALIARAREVAEARGLRVTVLTFEPHPLVVLAKDKAPRRIATRARREDLLRDAGADHVHVIPFDAEFARMPPQEFVDRILVGELHARATVTGSDFRFGAERAGDLSALREFGATRRFDVMTVGQVVHRGDVVSSTRVRKCLEAGLVEEASELLDRSHDVDGVVVEGHRRGRTIGFPTANLDCDDVLLPKDGVYMIAARLLDEPDVQRGVLNIGTRPTMRAGRSVEAHLFDFDREIYGRRIRVAFLKRIRDEQKFDGIDALVRQIHVDVDFATKAWTTIPPERIRCL